MYLKSLKVEDFASIAHAELSEFSAGLNIVVGDNEAGKSTLLKALRAAFFQKHRAGGEAVKEFQPYQGGNRPLVAVEFTLDGVDYHLEKAFLQRQSAALSWPGGALSGDAVEDRLAELLRFQHTTARKQREDDFRGAFGLLWVDQGRSVRGLDIGAGRDALTASLEGEVGQMLGGERGRGLIAAAKELEGRFFTATGKDKIDSPLKVAREEYRRIEETLTLKREAYRELAQKIDRLADRRKRLKDYEGAGTLAKAESALAEAEAAAQKAGERDREWQTAASALKHAEAIRQAAEARLRQRDALAKNVDTTQHSLDDALRLFAEADGQLREANVELTERTKERQALTEAERQAAQRHEAFRLAGEIERETDRLAELTRAIAVAEALGQEMVEKRRAVSAIGLDEAAVAAIDKAEQRRRDCEVKLTVAAPTISFAPSGDGKVIAPSGERLAAETAIAVTEPTSFKLEGFGRVTVAPGGNAASLAEEERAAKDALTRLLARHGAASPEEARAKLAEAKTLNGELAAAKAQIRALLPDGLDEARARREAVEAGLTRLKAQKAELAITSDQSMPGEAELRATLETASRNRVEAESREHAARRLIEGLAIRRGTAESEVARLTAERDRLGAELSAAEAETPRAGLSAALGRAEADREAKQAQVDLRDRERAESNVEAARREVEDRREALRRITQNLQALRDETLSLEGELRAEGGNAIGEDIARMEEELVPLSKKIERLTLEAEASKLLSATLATAQREARELWLGPIKARVAPYLRLLHPESEIDLDEETLEIRALRRRGVEERFERLSAGAREQVAVVARLSLAHVLKEGGHPAAVILDDALVNTDEMRLERMHRVLREAARELQVIVLTCRERDFRDLGAPMFRL